MAHSTHTRPGSAHGIRHDHLDLEVIQALRRLREFVLVARCDPVPSDEECDSSFRAVLAEVLADQANVEPASDTRPE